MDKTDTSMIYAHISRLYNSGISALGASIFGLSAYCGLALNVRNNLPDQKIPLTFFGIGIVLVMFYFFFRVLMFSRWLDQANTEYGLGPYWNTILEKTKGTRLIGPIFDAIVYLNKTDKFQMSLLEIALLIILIVLSGVAILIPFI